MNVQVEKLENSMAKLTIETTAEEFEAAIQKAYLKNRKSIQIPGFRKGKAPRKMIEKIYGVGVFFDDAANGLINETYPNAYDQADCEIVSQPEIDVVQIEAGKPFIYTALVAVKPVVTLGQYKGLETPKLTVEVTEDEIAAELKKTQEQQAREITVEDRPVADGDIAMIDFEGFCEGVAFEGGKGENYSLTIGSHSFVDTFEEQLIGHNAGEELEVNVTFPEQYQAENLAGKPAMFKVKINSIKTKEIPELDDDFASDVSDFDTLEEYKESVKKSLEEKKEKENKSAKESSVVAKAAANASMDMPAPMVEAEARQMVNDFAQRLQYQGMDMDTYMKYTGMTAESMADEMKPQAETRIRQRLVLEAIAAAEGIVADEADVEKEIENMAATYGMEADKVKSYLGDAEIENMKKDLAIQKAVDLLVAESVEVEEAAEE